MSGEQAQRSAASGLVARYQQFKDRLPRTLRPTKAGNYLLVIAMAMGFAALNTGNNLLFLAWGLVLGSIIVSGLLSESTLRILGVKAERQQPAFAGEDATIGVVLTNRSQRVSAYAVRLAMQFGLGEDEEAEARGYVLRAPPGSANAATTLLRFPRRGVWSLKRTYVRTQFPFGFFEKSRWFESKGLSDVLVYPKRVRVRFQADTFRPRAGAHTTTERGRGDEYFSLRPYRESDDVRHVHWKKSARRGHLVVQEYARETDDDILIGLRVGPQAEASERAVEVVAAVCEKLLSQGRPVGVVIPGRLVMPAAGEAQLARIRTALALCDLTEEPPLSSLPRGTPVVVVRAEGADALAGLPSIDAEVLR